LFFFFLNVRKSKSRSVCWCTSNDYHRAPDGRDESERRRTSDYTTIVREKIVGRVPPRLFMANPKEFPRRLRDCPWKPWRYKIKWRNTRPTGDGPASRAPKPDRNPSGRIFCRDRLRGYAPSIAPVPTSERKISPCTAPVALTVQ